MKVGASIPCLTYLRALSDETRWRIVRLLCMEGDTISLSQIAEKLQLSDYNVSRHVRILVEAGLLSIVRSGRYKQISIPESFRRNAVEGQIGCDLELGCCRFYFRESA